MAKETIGNEFLEYIIENWARNLWALNNKERVTDDASRNAVESELHKKWYPNNNRGLTKSQSISEQGFTLFAYGLTYTVGMVADKAADKIAGSKLVDAWRKAVFRNSFQQRYNVFEEILKETLGKSGEAAALAQFPKLADTSPAQIIEALGRYNYKSSFEDGLVKTLVAKTGNTPAAPKPAQNTP